MQELARKMYYKSVKDIPERLQTPQSVLQTLETQSCGGGIRADECDYINSEFFKDDRFVRKVVKYFRNIIKYCPNEEWVDNLVPELCRDYHLEFNNLPKRFTRDKRVIHHIVRWNHEQIVHVDPNLMEDREFVLHLVDEGRLTNPKFIPEKFRDDITFIMDAIELKSNYYRDLIHPMKYESNFVLMAVTRNGWVLSTWLLKWIKNNTRKKDIVVAAVTRIFKDIEYKWRFKSLDDWIRSTESHGVRMIPESLRTDRNVILAFERRWDIQKDRIERLENARFHFSIIE